MHRRLIIDGNNLAHRVKHTMRELRNDSGEETSIIYGVISVLLGLTQVCTYSDIVVCWDGGLSARRLHVLPEYKANRREKRDEYTPAEQEEYKSLLDQMQIARMLLSCLGVRNIQIKGVEADDLMAVASWLVQFEKEPQFGEACILSTDKDAIQLVNTKTTLIVPRQGKNILVRPPDVPKHTDGVPRAASYPFYHALVGDTGDNVPGVPGFGDKTAKVVLEAMGWPVNLEEFNTALENLDQDQLPGRFVKPFARLRQEATYKIVIRNLKAVAFDYISEDTKFTDMVAACLRDREPLSQDLDAFMQGVSRYQMYSLEARRRQLMDIIEGLRTCPTRPSSALQTHTPTR